MHLYWLRLYICVANSVEIDRVVPSPALLHTDTRTHFVKKHFRAQGDPPERIFALKSQVAMYNDNNNILLCDRLKVLY